jgi:hypothetical protein
MGSEISRPNVPARRLQRRNSMAFPRELRRAIPDLHAGRVLELDSITGQSLNTELSGPVVQLKLVAKETGKLTDEFVIRMDLQIDAARELAATLTKLADMAEAPGKR